ncbi:MAG: hypothetical protein IJM09_06795 [Neisseriaceae bacterium]|nr:hypothetical protein [Neisseriaceae bacterium]
MLLNLDINRLLKRLSAVIVAKPQTAHALARIAVLSILSAARHLLLF